MDGSQVPAHDSVDINKTRSMLVTMRPYRPNLNHDRFLEPMSEYAKNDKENIYKQGILFNYGKERSDEYDSFKYLYGNESEHAVLNALKQKAINVSHEYVVDPTNQIKRELFNHAQFQLRECRGNYIAKHTRSHADNQVFGYTPQETVNEKKYTIVEFTYTENDKNGIPIPIIARVDEVLDLFKSIDNKEDTVDVKKVVEIFSKSQHVVKSKFNCKAIEKELLQAMFRAVQADVAQHTQHNEGSYFKGLGSDADRWDDMARKEKKCGDWSIVKFRYNDVERQFRYRCDINLIIPPKIKVEHNVKTVHRFALDFTKILNPIHIDLVMEMTENRIEHKFTWTMHETEKGKHQVYHAGYFTEDARLFEMPGTLKEMTVRFNKNEDKYIDPFFSKATIDAPRIERNDYTSMLNLQVHALKKKLNEVDTKHDVFEYPAQPTDVGYIYKYNHYTIIASGIKYPIHEKPDDTTSKRQYINFYTIIHWNNTPAFLDHVPVKIPQVIQKPERPNEDVKGEIKELYDYIKGVNNQIGNLIAQRISMPEAASSKTNFFIPGILMDHTKKHQNISLKSAKNPTGVFYIEGCTNEDKSVIDTALNWEKIRLLRDHYGLEVSMQDRQRRVDLKDKMIEYMVHTFRFDKTQKIKAVPGLFGYFLQKTHQADMNDARKNQPGYKTGLETWSDFWHDYFEIRPKIKESVEFSLENSNKMRILIAEIEDKATKKYRQKWEERRIHQQAARHREDVAQFHNLHFQSGPAITESSSTRQQHGNTFNPGSVSVVRAGDRQPRNHRTKRDKSGDNPFFQNHFYKYNPKRSLAATVYCPEFTPLDSLQSTPNATKMQAEIDSLKRTLNELTLRAQT